MSFAESPINLALATITALSSFGLGIIVFSKRRDSWVNRSFAIFSFGAAVWIMSAYLSDLPQLSHLSLFLNRLIFFGLFFAMAGFSHFCLIFPEKKVAPNLLIKLVYLTAATAAVLSITTPLTIKDITFEEWGTDLVIGPLSSLLIAITTLGVVGVIRIILRYRGEKGLKRQQLHYLFLGAFLFLSTNILVHLILPEVRESREFYQIGNYSTLFLIGFTAYAIITYRLFDIRVVLTQVFVVAIALTLFTQVLMVESVWQKILNAVTLASFCFFGYLLIKSILREIHYREQLSRAYEKIKRIDKAKSEFISIASHQLRTPLTVIKGYTSRILEGSYGKYPEKGEKALESINQSNERLIRLVNDLLSVSRIESGKLELRLKPVSLENIISSVVNELKIKAEEKKLFLKWEEPKKALPKILADEAKIRDSFFNVIDNAIKYTEQGGTMIELKQRDSILLTKITDTGAGLSKDELADLFERFSRGEVGVRFSPGGIGLGLYITKRFLELHNGKIWAESKGKEQGSTFYIELPLK